MRCVARTFAEVAEELHQADIDHKMARSTFHFAYISGNEKRHVMATVASTAIQRTMTPATVPPLVIRFAAEVNVGRYNKRQRSKA
jgi:hypothetical protein